MGSIPCSRLVNAGVTPSSYARGTDTAGQVRITSVTGAFPANGYRRGMWPSTLRRRLRIGGPLATVLWRLRELSMTGAPPFGRHLSSTDVGQHIAHRTVFKIGIEARTHRPAPDRTCHN